MKGSRSTRASARKPAAAEPADPSVPGVRSAEVVLDVEVERHRVHLVLANCGDAVATDVQVTFSRELLGLGGSLNISALPVFTHLGVLRPGRALRIFWDAAPSLLAQRTPVGPFVATVSWSERSRPRQRADYHHDLSIYRDWPEAIEPETRE
jgi:hypothetical protein